MRLGLGLGLLSSTSLSSGGGTPAVYTQPYNYQMVAMGDSRTAQGANITGTYGVSGGLQYVAGQGPDSAIGMYSGHQLRQLAAYVNAGGPGQTVEGILAYPRTGTNTVDLAQIAALDIGCVVFYMGTNSMQNTPLATSMQVTPTLGTAPTAILNAIAALTNPAVNWVSANGAYNAPLPLAGGKPKNVIIINETPRGVAADGTNNSTQSSATFALPSAGGVGDVFEAYATWLKKFDYASGDALANPRVTVIDTFHDASILDTTTPGASGAGTSWLNQAGLFGDGLHPNPNGVDAIGKVAGTRLAGILTNSTPFIELPTSATASANLMPNPLFAAGTSVVSTLAGATLSSALLPGGTTAIMDGTGTGGTGTYHFSNAATASGTATLTTTAGTLFTATVTNGSTLFTVTGAPTGSITNGATITGAILPSGTSIGVSGSGTGLNINVAVNSISGTLGSEMVLTVTGTSPASAPTISIIQSAGSTALNSIDLSTDYIRGCANIKYTVGVADSVVSVYPQVSYRVTDIAHSMTALGVQTGSALGYGNNANYKVDVKNAFKDLGDGIYKPYVTPTSSLTAQGLSAGTHPTTLTMRVSAVLYASKSQNFVLSVSQMGAVKLAAGA